MKFRPPLRRFDIWVVDCGMIWKMIVLIFGFAPKYVGFRVSVMAWPETVLVTL